MGLGGVPTVTPSTATGTGPTLAVSGTDLAGTLTITTGTAPGTGVLASIASALAHGGTTHIVLTPANQAAAELYVKGMWAHRLNTATWQISTLTAPPESTALKFSYVVIQAQ